MELFKRRPLCNNNPDSAPQINGKPFLLCWRCVGAIIGILISLIVFNHLKVSAKMTVVALLSIPAILDYALNRLKFKRESNKLRFITGVLLGIAVGYVEILLLSILEMKG